MLPIKTIFSRQKSEQGSVQLLRNAVVGALATLVDLSLFSFLIEQRLVLYLIANILSYTTGMIVNYGLTVSWVFPHRPVKNRWFEFLLFALLSATSLALSELIIWLLVHFLAMHPIIAKILATAVTFVWNFILQKYGLFKSTKNIDSFP